jgi:hypothetical protein
LKISQEKEQTRRKFPPNRASWRGGQKDTNLSANAENLAENVNNNTCDPFINIAEVQVYL